MDTRIHNRSLLFNHMANGDYIITPNNRLSNQLLQEFILQYGPVQKKPHCLPYSTFLLEQYKNILHQFPDEKHPIVYNQNQARLLWELSLIQHDIANPAERLLSEVEDAWNTCQLWDINIQTHEFLQTPQTQQFQQWSKTYSELLKQHHALATSQIVPYLMHFPEMSSSKKYIWVSFDEFSPQQLSLQAFFKQSGHHNFSYDLEIKQENAMRYAAAHPAEEWTQLTHWLQEKLQLGHQSIGLIIPNLAQQAKPLLRHLNQSIPSEKFDMSLGQSFLEFPIIEHGMRWLELNKSTYNRHQIMLLLHSPYIGGSHTECYARAKLLDENKTLLERELPASFFIKILQSGSPKLGEILESITEYPKEATPHEWSTLFKTRLKSIGFPGEYALSSENFQTIQRLQLLFNEFEQLALVTQLMTKNFALTTLRKLAKSTIFQIQKTKAPIQILGLLEASGCKFDSIWVTGLTDQCLPQRTKLSSFIPLAIQRTHNMPRALAEKELFLAKQCLVRLQHGSQECVFSYPKLTEDIPNLPCPLIQHLPQYPAIALPPPKMEIILQYHAENYVIPIGQNEVLTGGSNLITEQAKCPFRAFAIHRLKAKPLLKQVSGLDAAERGQILHKILESIWQDIPSQQFLINLTNDELHARIHLVIQQVLSTMPAAHPYSFSPLIQEVEYQRLMTIVQTVMHWEKQRPAFAIQALEQSHTIELAGIPIQVRVDRMDSIAPQETWVIDYKSSLPSHKPWNEERPESPQLLLYALLDPSIKAILFLQLKSGNIMCCGTSEANYDVDGLSPIKKDQSWEIIRTEWRNKLTLLAKEFKEGQCAPNPQKTSTCSQCDYQDLCKFVVT